MPHTVICQKEASDLLEEVRPLFEEMISACVSSAADFHQVEEAIGGLIDRMRPLVVRRGLTTSLTYSPHNYVCPDCQENLTTWGKVARQIETSQGGALIEVTRYRCRACSCDYYPAMIGNGLERNNHFTVGSKQRIVEKAVESPYAHVSNGLPEVGIDVSAKEVDRITRQSAQWHQEEFGQEIAGRIEQREHAAMATFIDEDAPPSAAAKAPTGLFNWQGWQDAPWCEVSVDGGMVRSPDRDENGKLRWFEERSFVLKAFDPAENIALDAGVKIRSLTHDARTFHGAGVMTLDGTFDWLDATLAQRPPSVRNYVFVADDGQGHFTRARQHFGALAILILDIYHAAEHVGSGAGAIWGQGSPQVTLIKEQAIAALKEPGGPYRTIRLFIQALRASRASDGKCGLPSTVADKETLLRELRYLWRNRSRMKYSLWLSLGLPIGSGAMESGIKQVCVARLRKPGMMWTREGANAMLNLRSAHLSGCLPAIYDRKRQNYKNRMAAFFRSPIEKIAI